MKNVRKLMVGVGLYLTSMMVWAAPVWTHDIEVARLGTYQYGATHYVWFSQAIPGCTQTTYFNESNPGGKALLATLTTALINKRKVSVQSEGCDIIEIYLT